MAMGRPQKPYTCSWTDHTGKQVVVPGLYRCPDGRWRINATGAKFSERDERRAVQKFQDWQAQNNPSTVNLQVPYDPGHKLQDIAPVATANGTALPPAIVDTLATAPQPDHASPASYRIGYNVPESVVWPWLRELFITDAGYVAKMVGLPELAGYRHFAPPAPSIRLEALIDRYLDANPSTDKAKKRCVSIFRRLMDKTGAATLDDLTTEALTAYRQDIESSKEIESAQTKQWMYGQIKSLISFGLRVGLDEGQINAALARCKVLWTATAPAPHDPQPISREHFHKLLSVGNGTWRAWLLVGLNLCLHMDEVCGLESKDFDLEAGTYCAIRNKTKRERVPRAATLWPETVTAIRPLIGKHYLFTSPRGTRYSVNSRCNLFAELRDKAGVPAVVGFDSLRDGAYTAACRGQSNDQLARLLAGHKAEGLQDNYVLREPSCVKPACEAVYRYYGPF